MEKVVFELRSLDSLNPFDGNPRIHPDEQIRELADDIREYGFLVPILIDEKSTILAGHGRVMAARLAGLTEIPVVQASHLSEAQKRGFMLAELRIAEKGRWDFEVVHEILTYLDAEGFDLKLTGFDMKSLELEDTELDDVTGRDRPGHTDAGGFTDPERDITLTVPEQHAAEVRKWLAYGGRKTATGMGEGVLKRMGLMPTGAGENG